MFAPLDQKENKITVIVPYNRNAYGLVNVLCLLQNQTVKPDKIVIIDTSINKNGLSIAKMFSYGEIPLVVEVAQVDINEAWNRGIGLASDSHCLIINDDIIFPINFIQVLAYTLEKLEHKKTLVHVPVTSSKDHQSMFIDQTLKAWSEDKIEYEPAKWMPGFCFLLTKECIKKVGLFNTKDYTIWFGDTDYENRVRKMGAINLIKGLFVYHYGGLSYRYGQKKTMDIINKDRMNYNKTVRNMPVK